MSSYYYEPQVFFRILILAYVFLEAFIYIMLDNLYIEKSKSINLYYLSKNDMIIFSIPFNLCWLISDFLSLSSNSSLTALYSSFIQLKCCCNLCIDSATKNIALLFDFDNVIISFF